MFVSTHLISEFEGLIDRFTIIDDGRDILTLDADEARHRYQKIYSAREPLPRRSTSPAPASSAATSASWRSSPMATPPTDGAAAGGSRPRR